MFETRIRSAIKDIENVARHLHEEDISLCESSLQALRILGENQPYLLILTLGAIALKIGKFDTEKTVSTLLEKNRRYGNSALDPIRVASTAGPIEQIRVRIDDKLSRLLSSTLGDDEDPLFDLYGYCILGVLAK